MFIDKMHWTQPTSLLTYDHTGQIRRLMDWHLSPIRASSESNQVVEALGFSNAQDNGLTGTTRADTYDVV